jgi:hypothetical protein
MRRLKEKLDQVESLYSNSDRAGKLASSNSPQFEFDALTSGERGIPECFEIGRFKSSVYGEVPAFLRFAEVNGIAINIEDATDFIFYNELLERSLFKILSVIDANSVRLVLIDGKNYGASMERLSRLSSKIIGNGVNESPESIRHAIARASRVPDDFNTFIVINNFPHGFDNESASLLLKLLQKAHNKRVWVLMTREVKPTRTMEDLATSISERLENISFLGDGNWQNDSLCNVPDLRENVFLSVGSSFSESRIEAYIESVNSLDKMSRSHEERFDISDGLRVPIGTADGETFYFTLGHETENYHGIVAGASGQGKTVLLDNIIAAGASLYRPSELGFVLLDLKGIEFAEYRGLEHLLAYASSSDVNTGLKIVEYVERELSRREKAFRAEGVSNLSDYRKNSKEFMPRLLVIIDEFQTLFGKDYKTDQYVEAILIDEVVRKGRAFGIHLLCCTQSLGSGVRSSFLDNIPLRIAFRMAADVTRSFMSARNTAADSLAIGEIVYNSRSGDVQENKHVSVNHIKPDQIRTIVSKSRLSERIPNNITKVLIDQ